MHDIKQVRRREKGWAAGTVAEFLGLTPEESDHIEEKLRVAESVRDGSSQSTADQPMDGEKP